MPLLSVKHTIGLWGGWGRGQPVTRSVRAMDITPTIRELRPGWSPKIRVAAVHIGIEKFFWPRSKAADHALRRQIIDARRVLRDQGYTHICVTGPFLVDIRRRTRLPEEASFVNSPLIAKPMTALYCLRLALWSMLGRKTRTPERQARLAELMTHAAPGFTTQGIFEL